MQSKTERFEMRLDEETIERVDTWRSTQEDLPSRAEAIRRLVDSGLERSQQPTFSDGERFIYMLLRDIHKHLKVSGESEPDFVAEVLYGGHFWALNWQYPGLMHGHVDSRAKVNEVVDVLDMWSFLESGYAKLEKKDRDRVEKETGHKRIYFAGFDGNHEGEHMSIARFLVEQMGRFKAFQGRDLNSHSPSIEQYKRMIAKFELIRRGLVGRELGASEIIEVINAERRN